MKWWGEAYAGCNRRCKKGDAIHLPTVSLRRCIVVHRELRVEKIGNGGDAHAPKVQVFVPDGTKAVRRTVFVELHTISHVTSPMLVPSHTTTPLHFLRANAIHHAPFFASSMHPRVAGDGTRCCFAPSETYRTLLFYIFDVQPFSLLHTVLLFRCMHHHFIS